MVVPFFFIGITTFLALLIPFFIASATSLALPKAKPAENSPSPTTTKAEKPKFLPPLVTLVVRLIKRTFSIKASPLFSTFLFLSLFSFKTSNLLLLPLQLISLLFRDTYSHRDQNEHFQPLIFWLFQKLSCPLL